MDALICNSINQKRVIQFIYDNELRVVEPHCHGETTAGNEGLRAFQTGGYSSSGKMGWKLYDLSKANNIQVVGSFSYARPGYKRNDKNMRNIYCQL